MSLQTNLHGRLRNTNLPKSKGLLPLFEAVVNSIHSIEESGITTDNGSILVDILRSDKRALETNTGKKMLEDDAGHIVGFKIRDNGIGFTDENMQSFETLDSEHKIEKGCRGIGRLLWLKAFQRVNVESIYLNKNHELSKRTFVFNPDNGVSDITIEAATNALGSSTIIHLEKFSKSYRESSVKTLSTIAGSLFEHCLWYFVRESGAPKIIVNDKGESIDLDNIYEERMHASAEIETIDIKGVEFELTHLKIRASSIPTHMISFCAGNRLVKDEKITGKIPGLYGSLQDSEGKFKYLCYISSSFLDDNVRPERTGLDVFEDVEGKLCKDTEISLNDIRKYVINRASAFLSDFLEENKELSKQRVNSFISEKAPKYRPVLKRITDKEELNIDPNISDKELDMFLHNELSKIEQNLLSEGHEIMSPKINETQEDYENRLQNYLETAEDIKKSDLANYVSHRKVILDLLEKAIERQEDGKYAREDLIHKLIMPMGKDSGDILIDDCNLWLIDERLAFHNYLASDKTLKSMPITQAKETKEPDICALDVYDNPILFSEGTKLPLASIVVVEIKRPMRNDASEGEDKDPIEQALGYLDRIRQGNAQTQNGRPIPQSESIPGFCYVICDITKTIKDRCRIHDAVMTNDKMGYFFYNKSFDAYVEVISFDRLVNAAKERNRAFFDKLGLPTS